MGNDRTSYPLTLYGVAGTQTAKSSANSLVVFKMHNLHETKRKSKNNEGSEDESEDEEEENDPEKQPKLKVAGIKHTSGKLLKYYIVTILCYNRYV